MNEELETEGEEMAAWDGTERRTGPDRRTLAERRGEDRIYWERRSGQDRRGHPLYAPRHRPAK